MLDSETASAGAPVVYEDNPTYQNLIGRIEHVAQMGTLVTDFTLIKAGRAAPGQRRLPDPRRPRCCRSRSPGKGSSARCGHAQIRIESLGQALSLVSTVSLEPEPIPLDVKVVLLGEPLLYYLLHALDPDFGELFKVARRLRGQRGSRPTSTTSLYARLSSRTLAGASAAPAVRPRPAWRGVIEHSARAGGDARASCRRALRASTTCCGRPTTGPASAGHAAVDARRRPARHRGADVARAGRRARSLQEHILRGTLLIDTDGDSVGQVNGLSVIAARRLRLRPAQPHHRARPARRRRASSTSSARSSSAGPIHSKGVLILVGLPRRPLRARPAALALGQPGLRAELRRGRGRQRLVRRALRAAVGPRRAPAPAVARRHRLGQPARRGAGDRRRQREDRGLLRRLHGARPHRRAGRARSPRPTSST